MQTFSPDLRQRAIAAHDANQGTQQQVADRFKASVSWLRKVLRRRRTTNSIDPKPHGGRTRLIDGGAAGVRASHSMVHRAKKDLGATRKESPGGRPSRSAPELRAERIAWPERLLATDPAFWESLDETRVTTAMVRSYGRCASGKRVDGPVPHGH